MSSQRFIDLLRCFGLRGPGVLRPAGAFAVAADAGDPSHLWGDEEHQLAGNAQKMTGWLYMFYVNVPNTLQYLIWNYGVSVHVFIVGAVMYMFLSLVVELGSLYIQQLSCFSLGVGGRGGSP